MTLKEAIDVCKKNTNGMTPVDGVETTNYYLFFTLVNEKGRPLYNSSKFVVNKQTGESGWIAGMFSGLSDWDKYVDYGEEQMIHDSESLFRT